MKKTTFLKEYNRLTKIDKKELIKFWECKDTPDSIFDAIKNKFFTKISTLSKEEASVFFYLLISEQTLTERDLQRNTGLDSEKLAEAIESLSSKMLIYIRKTIAKLTSGNDKILVFNFIHELLEGITLRDNFEILEQKIEQGSLYLNYSNKKVFNLLFEFNGMIDAYSDVSKKNNLKKEFENGNLDFSIYFDGTKISPVYHFKEELISAFTDLEKTFKTKGLSFLNALGEMYYVLSTKRVLLNKNGELCKYDQEIMNDIFSDKKYSDFFVDILKKLDYIESDDKNLIPKKDFKKFLHKDISSIYKDIISQDKNLDWFVNSFLSEKWEFADIDVIRQGKNNDIKKEEAKLLIDIANYLGLVDLSTEKTYIASVLYEGYANETLYIYSEEPCFIVNSNFTLLAEKDKLAIYDEFLLKTFFNIENESKVIMFKMEKQSFLKGIFLGYNPAELIEMINKKAKKEIPEMIFTVLNDWYQSYKEVKIKKMLVITGDKEIIDIINYHKDVEKYILNRHGDKVLEIHSEGADLRFLEDENIFIVPEDL